MSSTIDKIKNFSWENRVYRTGFLQSKNICNEAELIPIQLTKNIVIKYENVFWIKDHNIYDDKATKNFSLSFEQAFKEDESWTLKQLEKLDKTDKEVTYFINKIKDGSDIDNFLNYVELLKQVQKYYVIAVPLTNYCESKLKQYPELIKKYATPYKGLEIDNFYKSKDVKKDFPWIKTAYNIIEELNPEELNNQNTYKDIKKDASSVPEELEYLINGLRIGIYIRNRIKELAQKLWYYIEPTAKNMAKEINISRDDFFYLTYQEAEKSYNQKKLSIDIEEINDRKKCFVVGFLNNKNIIISGKDADLLFKYFDQIDSEGGPLKGRIACKGNVSGYAKIIINKKDFDKLKQGDILIAPMTTPDFVPLMKKSAAIVTNEGGLSCHAAIVSRELNIPCIIGTKSATKAFSDGDYIKVDAEKGIVEKIN